MMAAKKQPWLHGWFDESSQCRVFDLAGRKHPFVHRRIPTWGNCPIGIRVISVCNLWVRIVCLIVHVRHYWSFVRRCDLKWGFPPQRLYSAHLVCQLIKCHCQKLSIYFVCAAWLLCALSLSSSELIWLFCDCTFCPRCQNFCFVREEHDGYEQSWINWWDMTVLTGTWHCHM